ncbi:MAG: gamma-glutamyltransferase, partial [Myxococcales bacterium]|nr:gamma-glutamyltransferase [Myxococcales bacterium]
MLTEIISTPPPGSMLDWYLVTVTPQASQASGRSGAIAAAHPEAVRAGLAAFEDGGGAVDAAIAAQAVLCVLMPEACGLGGDGMALVHKPGEAVVAVGGSGDAAARAPVAASSGGASVTVPGVVAMWGELSRFAIRPLAENLDRALDLCESGSSPPPATTEARHAHRHRIEDGGGDGWAYINATGPVPQPELASVLELVGRAGTDAFYKSWPALAVAEAAQKHGGFVEPDDLERIRVCFEDAISVRWSGGLLAVQPPPSQGILLAMSAQWFEENRGGFDAADLDHLAIEATEGAFAYRDDCAKGQALLDEDLEVDEFRARR